MQKRGIAAGFIGAVVLVAVPVAAQAQTASSSSSRGAHARPDHAQATEHARRSDRATHETAPRGPRVTLPDGETAVLAASRPITWDPGKHRYAVTTPLRMTPVERGKTPLGLDDLDHLPAPGDGTAEAGTGLLATVRDVRGTQLLDSASAVSATPEQLRVTRGPMAQPVARGGGRGSDEELRYLAESVVNGTWRPMGR